MSVSDSSFADVGRPLGTIDSGVVARVSPWGDVSFADESPTLRWFVAADDRWHDPSVEVAVRQRSVDGAPVHETRLRIPGGDVIQRAWSAVGPHGRPIVVLEFENDSRLAVVVALTRRNLAVSRPVAVRGAEGEWPAPGLDLPEAPLVIPVGHQTTVRVVAGVVPSGGEPSGLPDGVPDRDAVIRGWVSVAERGSDIRVPDVVDTVPVGERLVTERASVVLDPPPDLFVGSDPIAAAHWLLDAREAVRTGTRDYESSEVVTAVEVLLRGRRRAVDGFDPLSAAAIRATAELLGSDPRAVRDLERVVTGRRRESLYSVLADHRLDVDPGLTRGAFVTAVEESLVMPTGANEITVLPGGCPSDRLGSNFEAHGLRVGDGRVMSFAVRWHGSNAAILWEIDGVAPTSGVRMRSGADPEWTSSDPAGEGLLRLDLPVVDTSFS